MGLDELRFGFLPVDKVAHGELVGFSCGSASLDGFLRDFACEYHENRFAFTSVVFHEDAAGPVGYFTLANDAIPLNDSEVFELGYSAEVRLASFPAVRICRLAVREDLQGAGAGAAILRIVFGAVLGGVEISAARLVTVDAINDERVTRFYARNGFERSLWAEKQAGHNRRKNIRPETVKMICDILKR